MHLPEEQKTRFKAVMEELAQTEALFEHNVLDSAAAWSLHISDAERLKGVPAHVLEAAAEHPLRIGDPALLRLVLPDHGLWRDDRGGDSGPGTNPEQLFAAGYSSCFNGALGRVLRLNRVAYESSTVTAIVTLYEDPEDNGFKIGVKMQASIKGLNLDEARKYIELAHTVCPYSKAIKGNVEVELEVIE